MGSGAIGRAKLLGSLLTQEPALNHFLHPTQLLAAQSYLHCSCWSPCISLPVSSLNPLHPEGSLEKRKSSPRWKPAVAPV